MNLNSVRLFYVEGETEVHLIKKLELRGKRRIFNFWTTNVSKILRTVNKNYCVCIVYDTDNLKPKNILRFVEGVKRIADNCFKVILLQQTKNMEDELLYSCSCHSKSLFDAFKAGGRQNFKNQFNKTSNPIDVLNNLGFKKEYLWPKGIIPETRQLLDMKNIYYGNKYLLP